jgi:hypothetical protein
LRIQQPFAVATLALGLGMTGFAQSAPVAADSPALTEPRVVQTPSVSQATPEFAPSPAVRILEDFKAADVKFDLNELTEILRDRRHEGWVLAAYPDPRTAQPLIGAGFSLDLPERAHPQLDPLNQHSFLEPSSADLWQAAGLAPARLDEILKVFYERRHTWTKRTWRRQLFSLPAQISDEDAIALVRIGAIQATYNARAYCRNFDQMSGPQQMAMAQLVYQMGVNLEHFNNFLTTINPGPTPRPQGPVDADTGAKLVLVQRNAAMDSTMSSQDAATAMAAPFSANESAEYWLSVQKSLMGSQWAHKYRTRAIAVIAMLDPAYSDDPTAAEKRVGTVLRPAVAHRRGRHAAATREVAATTTHRGHGKKAGHASARAKRKRA